MTDETQDRSTLTYAQLEDALKVVKIKLEQSVKRLGGEIEPVPWSDVARQATATERVLVEFLAEISARIAALPIGTLPGAQTLSVARYREMYGEQLARRRIEVEIEAAEKTLSDLVRLELTQGGAPMPRPRRVQ